MRSGFKDTFQRVANAGRNISIVSPQARETVPPEVERAEQIAAWCNTDHPGYHALIKELELASAVAKDSQRVNLVSQPDVSYGLGMEDGFQRVLDLLQTRDNQEG